VGPGCGGALRTVCAGFAEAFDRSGLRAFVGGDTVGNIATVSLTDGSMRPFISVSPELEIEQVLVTERYLHVIVGVAAGYADQRYLLADGEMSDQVGLFAANSQVTSGPGGVCASGTTNGIVCTLDSAVSDIYLAAATPASYPLYLDGSWVYGVGWRDSEASFYRWSLDGKREQLLAAGVGPDAITSFGGCIYGSSSKVGVADHAA
jgi:hypothetical protein